jgi:ABC-type branched-subunit amino acid transport system substrate-binding protein
MTDAPDLCMMRVIRNGGMELIMWSRRSFLVRGGRMASVLGTGAWVREAFAEEKALSSRHVTLGTSMPATGPLGNAGQDHAASIQAAFAEINRAGGIHGRELRLVSKDDGYVPQRTAANIKEMLDSESVFALLSVLGTPNTAGVLPMIEKAGVPLLGPITGAASLRKPELRHVFHVRPSYTDEVQGMVQQLVQMGLRDIAIVYLDNPFGKEVLSNAQAALAQHQINAVAAIPLAVDGKNFAEAVAQTLASRAGAVFLGTTGTGTTDYVLALRARAAGTPILGLSVTYTDLTRLGTQIAGLGVATVFPSARSRKFAVVRSYWAAMEAAGRASSGLGLESWINAHVMAEGLRRAGRDLTREKLRSALSSIRDFNLGEVTVSFSPSAPYVGMKTVRLGVFDAQGVPKT